VTGQDSQACSVCMLPLSLHSTRVSLVDPTVPPVLSLPGAVRQWIVGGRPSIVFPGAPLLAQGDVFPHGSQKGYGSYLDVLSRAAGVVEVDDHPCLRQNCSSSLFFVGPDRTPKSNATWSGSTRVDNPGALTPAPGLRFVFPQASCSIS